jgi:hypothetical protein
MRLAVEAGMVRRRSDVSTICIEDSRVGLRGSVGQLGDLRVIRADCLAGALFAKDRAAGALTKARTREDATAQRG